VQYPKRTLGYYKLFSGEYQPSSDGQTDMARSTRLVMLIKNIYTLWGRKRFLHCVANFGLKSKYPLQGYKNSNRRYLFIYEYFLWWR